MRSLDHMHAPPEPPGYQRLAHHSLRHSLGTTVLVMFALASGFLFLVTVGQVIKPGPVTPALKAGLGFFGAMTLACGAGFLWLIRRTPVVEDLMVGERIVTTRLHRDTPVFRASHCLYFAGVQEAVAYRKALSGVVVGTHVFYLDDGAYLTEAGVQWTVGMSEARSAIVFMRAFQEFVLRRKPPVNTAFD
ncbi:MAG: hypothetical protein CFE44_19055 [Burkholderiales bacterium PBB4]|nr:MAG: hypothetical protein CFE44_19055 [Burkholderiales bacterium PBB4]